MIAMWKARNSRKKNASETRNKQVCKHVTQAINVSSFTDLSSWHHHLMKWRLKSMTR